MDPVDSLGDFRTRWDAGEIAGPVLEWSGFVDEAGEWTGVVGLDDDFVREMEREGVDLRGDDPELAAVFDSTTGVLGWIDLLDCRWIVADFRCGTGCWLDAVAVPGPERDMNGVNGEMAGREADESCPADGVGPPPRGRDRDIRSSESATS